MNEKELANYLEENLSIVAIKVNGRYGSGDSIKIQLNLKNNTISETYIDK